MIQDRVSENQRQLAGMMNYVTAEMESITGMPGILPRLNVGSPPTQIVHRGDVNTYNNINVDRSTVGAINTGSVDSIDVTLGQLTGSGAEEAAAAIKEFTEALVTEAALDARARRQMLEMLAFIAEQLVTPERQRKPSVVRQAWETITTEASKVAKLAAAWEKARSILGPFFG